MKIILKRLGDRGSKMHVNAEEAISSVKSKAGKKFDLKQSEDVRLLYSGMELEDHRTLADQDVRPNSVLHLVRTKIHPLVIAQRYPVENKALCPPGAFKKKSDLSVEDGHVFLMEYLEERPLLLGNAGMGARLCTYYQKLSIDDQIGDMLHNSNSSLGTVLTLHPADKSPFLGEGKLSVRRIDNIHVDHVVGQQALHMEVMSPVSKGLQLHIMKTLLVYIYEGFKLLKSIVWCPISQQRSWLCNSLTYPNVFCIKG